MKMTEEKIIAYLQNELSAADRKEFEKQIEMNPKYKDELNSYMKIYEELDQFQSQEAPDTLKNKLNVMLEKEIRKLESSEPAKVFFLPVKTWKAVGIAASLLIGGILIGYRMQPQVSKLAQNEREISKTITGEFVKLVNQEKSSQRILGVSKLESPGLLTSDILQTLEEVLKNDPSTNVRLAVSESLGRHLQQEEVKSILLDALTAIKIPIVRISIIEQLTKTGEQNMIPAFENLLDDDELEKSVRDEVHVGIMKLSSNI